MAQTSTMSSPSSQLQPLLSEYDLRVACAQCCNQERQVTYTLKSVEHTCSEDLLLCRTKGGSCWRPVSKRPVFPSPARYELCHFFVEGSGCQQHHNRCRFATSTEEAAVWTFEKRHRLDRQLLFRLLTQSAEAACPSAEDIFESLDLKLVCHLCCVRLTETTFTLKSLQHQCPRQLLLVKTKQSDVWRPVSERPAGGRLGQNVVYQKCSFFVEGSGCTRDGNGCTFARSHEEAAVWNYMRDKKVTMSEFIRVVTKSVSETAEEAAERIHRQFSGTFLEVCKACFEGHPQVLTTRKWSATCSSKAAHPWDPILLYHVSENARKHIYSQLHPLPQNCSFIFCSHVRQGKPCWHPAGHCQDAKSTVEMAVWNAEHGGLNVRPHLLSKAKQTEPSHNLVYCKVCLLVFPSLESYHKHRSSLEHVQLVNEDTRTKCSGRKPPHNLQDQLRLCDR